MVCILCSNGPPGYLFSSGDPFCPRWFSYRLSQVMCHLQPVPLNGDPPGAPQRLSSWVGSYPCPFPSLPQHPCSWWVHAHEWCVYMWFQVEAGGLPVSSAATLSWSLCGDRKAVYVCIYLPNISPFCLPWCQHLFPTPIALAWLPLFLAPHLATWESLQRLSKWPGVMASGERSEEPLKESGFSLHSGSLPFPSPGPFPSL